MSTLVKYDFFKLEHLYNEKVLAVTFSRPPVNAFIKECYEELSSIINYVNNNSSIASLILKSDQMHFSAGADVKQLKKDAKDTLEKNGIRRALLRKAWYDLHTCNVPVIVAINGAAVGIGAVLAACGDIIVAEENAFLSIPEINIGLIGGAKGLSRLLPPQKIRTLALTGSRISAKEIDRYGGIESIVSREELDDKAFKYATIIADKGAKVVRKWKEALILTESIGIAEGALIESCLSQELAK